jgi:hypothetical protein
MEYFKSAYESGAAGLGVNFGIDDHAADNSGTNTGAVMATG